MIDSLRISVTRSCNLKCPYCHKEGQLGSDTDLPLEIIDRIATAAANQGISRVKLTGGEPLLHPNIVEVVKILKSKRFADISMVTNGTLLARYARSLATAGLDRVNIGCDSLRHGVFKSKSTMVEGLEAAKAARLHPIKLNMIVMHNINDDEIEAMMDFARMHGAALQLIELIDFGDADNGFFKDHHLSLERVEAELASKASKVVQRGMQARRQYLIDGLVVEVVRPFRHGFCQNCTRMRVTSDGKLKSCLMRNDDLVLFENDESLVEAIKLKV